MDSRWTCFGHAGRLGWVAIALCWALPAAASKVACVGDSITYGYNLTNPSRDSYPSVLQTLLGAQHTVQNFGSSGCTLLKKGDKPYWNDAQFSASDAFKPDVVVVMLGTNDAKPQNWSHQADFTGDYNAMIDHYRALGAQVYVAAPPPVYPPGAYQIDPTVLNDQIVPLIRQIASAANAPVVDVFQALSGQPSLFPDMVHPNVEGAKLIAQTVAAALQKNGFGGAAGTGGAPGVGGANSGGVANSGGAKSSGGAAASGGAVSSGGLSSAGGGSSSSFATALGGTLGTGGSTRGSGGASVGMGGSKATGGTSHASGDTTAQAGQTVAVGGAQSRDTRGQGGVAGANSGTTSAAGASGGIATVPAHTNAMTSVGGDGELHDVGGTPVSVAQNPNPEGCGCHVPGRALGRTNDQMIALFMFVALGLRCRQRRICS